MSTVFGWVVVMGWMALIVYCPILKPWFGFRKPKNPLPGHRWFQ